MPPCNKWQIPLPENDTDINGKLAQLFTFIRTPAVQGKSDIRLPPLAFPRQGGGYFLFSPF